MICGAAVIERRWVRSGVVEAFDQRQERLLAHILATIKHYYFELHGTCPCYQQPLSLSRLAKLARRSGSSTIHAIRILANTVTDEDDGIPLIHYRRISARRNASRRPYQIFLRARRGIANRE